MFLFIVPHALQDPRTRLFGILIRSILILEPLLDIKRLWDVGTLFDRWPRRHHFLPLLQGWELVDLNASPGRPHDPADAGDVGNGDVVANNESGFRELEMLVQHTVQTPRLIDITIDAVLDLLRCVPHKMVGLALHRPQTTVLEEQPVVDLVVLAATLGVADLVVLVVLLGQVLQHTAALEYPNLLPVAEGVGHCWDATVRVDLEEPWFLLLVGRNVYVLGLIGQTKLFQPNRDFNAIGRRIRV